MGIATHAHDRLAFPRVLSPLYFHNPQPEKKVVPTDTQVVNCGVRQKKKSKENKASFCLAAWHPHRLLFFLAGKSQGPLLFPYGLVFSCLLLTFPFAFPCYSIVLCRLRSSSLSPFFFFFDVIAVFFLPTPSLLRHGFSELSHDCASPTQTTEGKLLSVKASLAQLSALTQTRRRCLFYYYYCFPVLPLAFNSPSS
jgi:hypothetical protein